MHSHVDIGNVNVNCTCEYCDRICEEERERERGEQVSTVTEFVTKGEREREGRASEHCDSIYDEGRERERERERACEYCERICDEGRERVQQVSIVTEFVTKGERERRASQTRCMICHL